MNIHQGIQVKSKLHPSKGLMLTPLIDMVFLMVIFFVINTSLTINPSIEVDLPEASSQNAVLENEIIVTITRSGSVYINSEQAGYDEFQGVFQNYLQNSEINTVHIRGDEGAPYGLIVEIMDSVRLLGIDNISLATRRSSTEQ
ncbi:MAG: ExbD/TolR family protein [Spirochaetia bacterium]